jgi:hypothetical protein
MRVAAVVALAALVILRALGARVAVAMGKTMPPVVQEQLIQAVGVAAVVEIILQLREGLGVLELLFCHSQQLNTLAQ